MKILAFALILVSVLIFNFSNSFAQEDFVPPNPPEMESNQNALPVNSEMEDEDVAEEASVPELNVPMQVMPAETTETTENEKPEAAISDTRVIIENVTTPAEPAAPVIERNTFARIKQLAGRWEGSGAPKEGSSENQEKVAVTYEVTSGGYAVLERLFPGTPQEMVTMYFEQKGQLQLMHYCMIGTRSLMAINPISADIKPGEEPAFDFSLAPSPGLNPEVDTHMHTLKISFIDPNRIKQEWTMYEAGKESGVYSFDLTRVALPSSSSN